VPTLALTHPRLVYRSTITAVAMTEPHLLKVPTELEAQYQALLKMFTAISQREPTVDDKNAVRVDLGLPLWRSRGSRDTLTDHSASRRSVQTFRWPRGPCLAQPHTLITTPSVFFGGPDRPPLPAIANPF